MRLILILLLFSSAIFAYDLDPLFLIDGCVDVRTGEWILQKENATYRSLESKWHLYPHTHLTLYGPHYELAEVREKTGLLLTYTQDHGNSYALSIPGEVTNTSLGKIGARTNLSNQTLLRADKFTFLLETPEKTQRIYQKNHHEGEDLHFLLKEERFADGMILHYRYDREHKLYAINGTRVELPNEKELLSGRVTERNGTTFTYERDKTTVSRKDGTKTLYHFTPEKKLTCIEEWDEHGELIQKTSYLFSETGLLLQKGDHTYSYDQRGNPIEEEMNGIHLLREFDGEDRVALLTEEKNGSTLKTRYSYSNKGILNEVAIDDGKHYRVIAIEGGPDFPTAVFEKAGDTLLKITRYTYGKEAIREDIFDPDGTLCFTRNIASSKIHKPWLEIYPIGTSMENGYEIERDYFGRMIARQKGDREEAWTYNAFHLLAKTDEHGLTTSYHYNEAGQKIEESLSTQKGPITTTFHYDASGRLAQTIRGEITTNFVYDKQNEILETREETLDGRLLTRNAPPPKLQTTLKIRFPKKIKGVHTETDAYGNITSISTQDETIYYTITYNSRNQPLCMTDHVSGRKGYRKYDDLGNLVEETLLNGLTLKSTRDLYGRRTELLFPDQSKAYMHWGPKFLAEIHRISHKRKYDYLHQFTEYNLLGFPVRQRQIADFGEISYKVDEEANVVEIHSRFLEQRPEEIEIPEIISATAPYTYLTDGLGRITEISQPGRKILFTYDVWNRRMTKTVIEEVQDTRYDPVDLAFLYDDTREIGAMSRYHDKLVELRVIPEAPVNPGDGAISYELGNLLYLPQFDLLGNPACLISVIRGKLMESYHFSSTGACEILDVYGAPLKSSKALNPWAFQGYRQDPETGLYYIEGDYYDPSLQVFISNEGRKLTSLLFFQKTE